MTPIVLGLGETDGHAVARLLDALRAGQAQVVHFGDDERRAQWVAEHLHNPSEIPIRPQLLLVSAPAALGQDGLLAQLGATQPWDTVPIVVVADADDDTLCRQAYESGAASWVVIPQGAEAVETFARYWMHSNLLPA